MFQPMLADEGIFTRTTRLEISKVWARKDSVLHLQTFISIFFVNEFESEKYDQAVDTFMNLLNRKVEVCLLPVRGEEEANAYMQLRADNTARNNAFLNSIGYGNG